MKYATAAAGAIAALVLAAAVAVAVWGVIDGQKSKKAAETDRENTKKTLENIAAKLGSLDKTDKALQRSLELLAINDTQLSDIVASKSESIDAGAAISTSNTHLITSNAAAIDFVLQNYLSSASLASGIDRIGFAKADSDSESGRLMMLAGESGQILFRTDDQPGQPEGSMGIGKDSVFFGGNSLTMDNDSLMLCPPGVSAGAGSCALLATCDGSACSLGAPDAPAADAPAGGI